MRGIKINEATKPTLIPLNYSRIKIRHEVYGDVIGFRRFVDKHVTLDVGLTAIYLTRIVINSSTLTPRFVGWWVMCEKISAEPLKRKFIMAVELLPLQ